MLAAALATIVTLGGLIGSETESGASRYGDSVGSTIADIQSYWAQTLPSVYDTNYKAIPSDRLFAYSQSNPPPACGGYGRTPYSEVAGNAFYCDQGDFVAWDEQGLFAKLRQQYGDFAPALVLAHEWGHAIQARVGFEASADRVHGATGRLLRRSVGCARCRGRSTRQQRRRRAALAGLFRPARPAWPAELPPPTSATSSPSHSFASTGEAQ